MPSLSVIIITKNEAQDIRNCLESIKWADEIVVVDSGSTDETVNICREYTDKVWVMDWPGYGIQKNRVLQQATSDWVLSLDADEQVSAELANEIKAAIQHKNYKAFAIPFQSTYCGTAIKHGAWHTKTHIRLFQRAGAKFTDAIVHENIIINGKIGKLKNHIIHHTYKNLEEVLDKLNRYTTYGAQLRFGQGKKGGMLSAIAHASWAFWRSYLFQLGFLDGAAGLMLAISNAEYCYYRYLKLMYLNKSSIQKIS